MDIEIIKAMTQKALLLSSREKYSTLSEFNVTITTYDI